MIYEWGSNKQIKAIDDPKTIDNLVSELNAARAESVSDTGDIASPDYRILFMNGEDSLKELGYYSSEAEDRYIDVKKEMLYVIDYSLPLE
ncbi:hypothetical protein ACFQ2J_10175 [Thalassobacillus hwangdonensis]|uniref:Uncharacterized protein n=1 Tax=Thalassobacillus hwangdonensis TaxID=546108 RepID=A0ABW3L0C0_9BACI